MRACGCLPRAPRSAAEISYHVRFTSCMVIGKLALSAMSALLLSTLPPAASAAASKGLPQVAARHRPSAAPPAARGDARRAPLLPLGPAVYAAPTA